MRKGLKALARAPTCCAAPAAHPPPQVVHGAGSFSAEELVFSCRQAGGGLRAPAAHLHAAWQPRQEARLTLPALAAAEPCRTPFKHPFFRMRLQELAGLLAPAPLEQRKIVLYFSRNHGGTKAERQARLRRARAPELRLHMPAMRTAPPRRCRLAHSTPRRWRTRTHCCSRSAGC